MTALRRAIGRIGNDLIAKRLWPVALALLAAIAVVPMALGGSSSQTPAPVPAAAAPPAASDPAAADDGAASASASSSARHARTSGGAVRDPFYDPAGQPDAASATAGADPKGATRAVADPPAAAGKGAASTEKPAGAKQPASTEKPAGAKQPASTEKPASAKKPSSTEKPAGAETPSTPKPTPAPVTTPTPAPSARPSYYRAVARWGTSRHAAPHAIARLTPLGGRHNPAALFLGLTKPGATYAIFVLGRHAVSRGDGSCRAETQCRMIALRPGDTRWFEVRSPADGSMRRYTLRISSLRAVRTTASAARRGRIRVHPDGRRVLHAMWGAPGLAEVLSWASYDRSAGLLRPAADRDDVEKPAR